MVKKRVMKKDYPKESAKNKNFRPAIKFLVYLILGIFIIYIIYLIGSSFKNVPINVNTAEAETLAKCLTDKGAKMYGAYWCPHCQNQKALFGEAVKYMPYVECDPNGENANPQECLKNSIQGYPTWIINGQKYEGEQTFSKLKSLTGC